MYVAILWLLYYENLIVNYKRLCNNVMTMKWCYKIFFIVCLLLFTSCGVKKVVSVSGYYTPTAGYIPLVQTNQTLPDKIYRIGSIVVGENGFTPSARCSYEECIKIIEEEARQAGAQLIYLVRVREPDAHSTCYNITAELYRFEVE